MRRRRRWAAGLALLVAALLIGGGATVVGVLDEEAAAPPSISGGPRSNAERGGVLARPVGRLVGSAGFVLRATRPVVGVVLDAEDRPVPGASITLHELGFTGREIAPRTTGPDGRFDFGAQPAEMFHHRYFVVATEAGRQGRELVDLSGSRVEVVVRLAACPAHLRGRVVDVDRRPISTARLEVVAPRGIPLASLPTDGGRFEVCVRPREMIVASAPGYGAVRVDGGAPADELEVVLLPGGRIVGEVVDEDGGPVRFATVQLWIDWSSTSRRGHRIASYPGGTGGRFTIDDVAPGRYSLYAEARGVHPPEHEVEVVIQPGDQAEALIVMKGCRSIEGRVVRGGEPVAGARMFGATTGADGSFRLDCVERGAFDLEVGGYAVVKPKVPAGGDVRGLVVEVRGEVGTVEGVVRRHGRPVAGARVDAAQGDKTGSTTFADASGAFQLRNVRSGSTTLRASLGEASGEAREIAIEPGGTARVELTVGDAKEEARDAEPAATAQGGTLAGVVSRADGGPLVAEVWIEHSAVVVTDRAGRFRIAAGATPQVLRARAIDGARGLVPGVTAGSTVDVRLAPGASIVGTVDSAERGCPTFIMVYAKGEPDDRSTYSSDGEFELADLAPGAYAVSARCPVEVGQASAYPDVRVEVVAGQTARVTL